MGQDRLKLADDPHPDRKVVAGLLRAGLEFDRRRRRITSRGRKDVDLPFRYLADDQAGPNFTGQPAVES